MKINIIMDETTSVGSNTTVILDVMGHPTDAQIYAVAEAIMATDAVQNSPQWSAPPSLTIVSVDEQRTIEPPV